MKRIIVHWTAGSYNVNETDRAHYHYIVDGTGKVIAGIHKPEDNASTSDGNYAAHTKNCNTDSIGISIASMAGAVENPFSAGKYPLTKLQWDTMVDRVAQLAKKYNIPVSKETILTHAEVEGTLGIQQNGKWDITRLPFDESVKGAAAVGDKLRKEVSEAMAVAPPVVAPKYVTREELADIFMKIANELRSI